MTSYQYGRSLVSITDEDEAAAKFEGGPKAMCLFGFVPRDEIQASEAQLEFGKYIRGHGPRPCVSLALSHGTRSRHQRPNLRLKKYALFRKKS
jgi:hypothetical protein